MALQGIELTKDDFDNLPWEDVINEAKVRSCYRYFEPFFDAAKQAAENEDEKAQEVYSLLGAITSFVLKIDTVDGPFHPLFVFDTSRGYMPDDIPEQHLDILSEVVSSVSDAELRARIADLLWITKRDYKMAQLAVTSYLQAAMPLEGDKTWPECLDRMERALDLAATLDRKGQLHQDVIDHFTAYLDRISPSTAPYYAIARAMELLQQQKQGEPVKYAAEAEKAALQAEAESNWLSADRLWRVKARWHAIDDDPTNKHAALVMAAETHVKYTEQVLNLDPPNYLIAQANLQQAIEGLRRAGGMSERVDELHKQMLEYQEKGSENMGTFSTSIDLTEPVTQTRRAIEGKHIYDALFTLVGLASSPSIGNLRTYVEDLIRDYPLQFAIAGRTVTEKGKVTANRPSVMTDDLDEQERGIRAEMFRQAGFQQDMIATGIIMPAIDQINLEHNVRIADFLPLLVNNPFVPPGREQLYAQGFVAGIQRYFVFATHLLLPQIEQSIRYLLYRQGAITSKLDSDGIQDEFDLNRMLYMTEVKDIFGDDIVFDLQGLLIERFGTNLRNLTAHGLLSYEAFFSPRVVYLWWLTLRLCCLPILAQMERQGVEREDIDDES